MHNLVFIASPLRADTPEKVLENQKFALDFIVKLWKKREEVGFAPHLYFTQFLNDQVLEEREAGMFGGTTIMRICEKMYVLGPRISPGMEAEIAMATELGIPIIYVENIDSYFADKINEKEWFWKRWLKNVFSLLYYPTSGL